MVDSLWGFLDVLTQDRLWDYRREIHTLFFSEDYQFEPRLPDPYTISLAAGRFLFFWILTTGGVSSIKTPKSLALGRNRHSNILWTAVYLDPVRPHGESDFHIANNNRPLFSNLVLHHFHHCKSLIHPFTISPAPSPHPSPPPSLLPFHPLPPSLSHSLPPVPSL